MFRWTQTDFATGGLLVMKKRYVHNIRAAELQKDGFI